MKDIRLVDFISSYRVSANSLNRGSYKNRVRYFTIIQSIVTKYTRNQQYANLRLKQYKHKLLGVTSSDNQFLTLNDDSLELDIDGIFKLWWRKYPYWLLCDLALILNDRVAIEDSFAFLKSYVTKKTEKRLEVLLHTLFDDGAIPEKLKFMHTTIQKFRKNRQFTQSCEQRILVVANMSSGKSTLINALVGKPIVRTSQQSCTANLSYIFNKVDEDYSVHLQRQDSLNLDTTIDELIGDENSEISFIATYFRSFVQTQSRVCYIDTPGINSVMHKEHHTLTLGAITDENYDKVLCVLNANKVGTDEEREFIKLISKSVNHEKIIFALNKIDDFHSKEDSIGDSLNGIYEDLKTLGFENPIVCPISAYFTFLLKRKVYDDPLTEDEQDVFDMYVKKFSRDEFDLSKYIKLKFNSDQDETFMSLMGLKSGFFYLEYILYGGTNVEKSVYQV